MINFRFHLVSLVAVFLALTVGIVVGATIVNRGLIDTLNGRVDKVERDANNARSQNAVLSKTAKQLESYLKSAGPYVVEGRLTAVPVVVVAEHGVDRGNVRALVTLLQDAGAQAPAIVWLQSKWLLDQPADRTKLAQIVGGDAQASGLRAVALDALAHRLATAATNASVTASSTTPTSAGAPSDLLDALASAGFLSIEAVGEIGTTDLSTFPPPGVRAVLVSGEASDMAAEPLVTALATDLSTLPVPTVVGEVYRPTEAQLARGAVVAPFRDDKVLHNSIGTVDDVDLVQGQVALILAVGEAADAKVGHYGYGRGADQALPQWSGP
jgi:hypothetical protein